MSTVFPVRENARDCTDKSRACGAKTAWLNYYIKSIRRLGRGPEISADLGEKSGMTGSCERDACDGAWLKPSAVRSFAAHPSKRWQPDRSQQGISSTDKDVMNEGTTVRETGGFSSSLQTEGSDATVRVKIARLPACGVALVDGRCRRGLDSGAVSVKLPLGAREVRRPPGRFDCAFPDPFRSTRIVVPCGTASRRRSGDRPARKEVPPLTRRQPVRMGGADPVATRHRSPKGNKAGTSRFMRTSGATSA